MQSVGHCHQPADSQPMKACVLYLAQFLIGCVDMQSVGCEAASPVDENSAIKNFSIRQAQQQFCEEENFFVT